MFTDRLFKVIHDLLQIDAQTDVTMTYAELRDNILRAASSLYERGLRKAEVTLIISNNHVLFPVACYAVTYLGGIASTVNPHYTTGRPLRINYRNG